MGVFFRVRTQVFPSFDDYRQQYGEWTLFPFMLDGQTALRVGDAPQTARYTLIFGNEARGLDPTFARVGSAIYIPQTEVVDSFGLPIAVAIGTFAFTTKNPRML